jgi:hypothetical protein
VDTASVVLTVLAVAAYGYALLVMKRDVDERGRDGWMYVAITLLAPPLGFFLWWRLGRG